MQHDFFHDIIEEELKINHDAYYGDLDARHCSHKWHPTVLLFTTVYDCVHCGEKKENV
jgi:hypothetical protein